MMKHFLFSFWLIAVLSMTTVSQPIQLHPENPHYFLFRDEPTILITSGEHYGAVLNLAFDYIPYLDELQANRLNMTRTFSGVYCEPQGAFNIEHNTLAPAPNHYISPWARSHVPGYANGGNKFNLNRWDEKYFVRLKNFIHEASQRGIVVEYVFFCPMYREAMWELSPMNAANNINGLSQVDRNQVYTMKDRALLHIQDKFVDKVIRELQDFDNIIFEVCNEPYFGNVTKDWHDRMIRKIVESQNKYGSSHLIAHNIANGSKVIESPNKHVSVFNFHYAYPPKAVEQNYHLNKVIGYDETGFAGDSDAKYRGDGWAFIIAGGGLYDNLDYSFTTEHEEGTAKQNAPGGGSPTLRKQLNILRTFMERFDFIQMEPRHELLQSIEGDEKTRGWVLAQEGKAYAVYLRFGHKSTITMDILEGTYRAEWHNTQNGIIDKERKIKHSGGDLRLVSPEFDHDIALRIIRVDS